ncbi:MAG: MFS transporter [Patescibacteria group bacterium]
MLTTRLTFFQALLTKDTRAIYYVLVFSFDFLVGLTATIYSLYLLRNGLDLFQVNLVNTVFMLGSVIFEIPTGALADYAGRKISVLLSFACLPIGFGIYYFSSSIGWFMFAELWIAFAVACLSGALDAWVIDQIQHQGYTSKTDLVFSHGGIASGLALLLGGVIGAQLGNISLGLPFGFGAIFGLLVLLFTYWGMMETINHTKRRQFHWLTGVKSIRHAFNPVVIWLLLATGVANFAFQPLNMYWSPRVMEMTNHQVWLLSYVWIGVSLSLMLGAYLAQRFTKFTMSQHWLFVITTLILALPIIIIASTSVVSTLLSGFFIYEIGRGLLTPLHKSFLNKHIPANERATLLSFDSLISKLCAGAGLILFGYLARQYSISLTWLLAGLILLFLIPLYYYATKNSKLTAEYKREN